MLMIDKAIKTVSTRMEIIFIGLGSGTEGSEIINESPSAHAIFSSHKMAMKEVSGKEIAIHSAHMSIHHIARTVCRRGRISEGKGFIFETKFDESIKSRSMGKMFDSPDGKISHLSMKL